MNHHTHVIHSWSFVGFIVVLMPNCSIAGHRGGVSSLGWDPQGMRVASGSEDGELVVWDVVSK